MRRNYNFILISLLLLVSISCKKVTDEIDPEIIIEFPIEYTSFNVPDTMLIKAVVSDDNQVESIQIAITDENFVTVFGAYSYPPNGNPTNIEDELVIDDILMESGVYYLKIRVFDGVNSKNAFRKIYINEVPRKLKRLVVISKNTGSLSIQSIDSTFSLSTLYTVNGSFEVSEINSRHQLLYIAGKYYDHLKAFNLNTNEEEWMIEGKNYPPLPYFRYLYFNNDLYVSSCDGEIRAYNENLTNVVTAVMQENLIPGLCYQHGEYIISEAIETTGSHSYLLSFFAVSGSLYYKLLVDMDVIGIFTKDENKVYVIGNKQNDGGVYVYDVYSNEIDEIRSFTGEKVIASEFIDNNNLFLAFDDGVYQYTYSNNSLTPFVENSVAQTICFDELGNILYIAESNKVSSYTYPQGSQVNSVEVTKEILNMHLHYNK